MQIQALLVYFLCLINGIIAQEIKLNPVDLYVDELPGLDSHDSQYPIMHAGTIPINGTDHSGNMFFWRVQAEQFVLGRKNTVIWLNGGPGCSSMDGILMEIGPFRVSKDGNLRLNSGSWHKHSTLVFLDQPLGVGFSSIDEGKISELDQSSNDLVMFLDKYLEMFPEERKNDLYLAGESFAGQYIPYFAKHILDRNDQVDSNDPKHINLAGISIGNGWIDPIRQYLSFHKFVYENGMVDASTDYGKHFDEGYKQCVNTLSTLDKSPIHVPKCEEMLSRLLREYDGQERCFNVYDIRLTDTFPACGLNWPPDISSVTSYLSKSEVQKALHVTNQLDKWNECSDRVSENFKTSNSQPSIEFMDQILKQIPVMLFVGDKDFLCNTDGMEMMIDSMKIGGPVSMNSKEIKISGDSKPVGSLFQSDNLSYYKVYDASHMAAYDYPETVQSMFYEFINVDANSTMIIPDSPAKDKLVNDAMWKAYYQAGAVALVIVLIASGALIWFVFVRKHRKSGVRFTDDPSEISLTNIFKSLATGMTRWVPGNSKKGKYYGSQASEEELAEFELRSESEEELDILSVENSEENSIDEPR